MNLIVANPPAAEDEDYRWRLSTAPMRASLSDPLPDQESDAERDIQPPCKNVRTKERWQRMYKEIEYEVDVEMNMRRV
ncbi:Ger(x)C family spore germination C-terminal domain-containing protein, partial [Mycobacterium sp. E3298]|uniref:Ger(x)C family spore germination C-terminal domain-containing protein n=1 Tax=Mycobacterium sp. E3298 TaxID=1856865 RepID=UPI001E3D5AC7